MGKKVSKKSRPANQRYKAESRWLSNAKKRKARHEREVLKKEAKLKRRAQAGKPGS